MAYMTTDSLNHWKTLVTIHLDNSDIVAIGEASSSFSAFVNLISAIAGSAIVGGVISAIAAASVWRLRSVNRKYGENGLRMTFEVMNNFYRLEGIAMFAVATLRLKRPY